MGNLESNQISQMANGIFSRTEQKKNRLLAWPSPKYKPDHDLGHSIKDHERITVIFGMNDGSWNGT